MYTHLYNSEVIAEGSNYRVNAFFSKDDGTDLNTGLGFDHMPTQEEIDAAVSEYASGLV